MTRREMLMSLGAALAAGSVVQAVPAAPLKEPWQFPLKEWVFVEIHTSSNGTVLMRCNGTQRAGLLLTASLRNFQFSAKVREHLGWGCDFPEWLAMRLAGWLPVIAKGGENFETYVRIRGGFGLATEIKDVTIFEARSFQY